MPTVLIYNNSYKIFLKTGAKCNENIYTDMAAYVSLIL